jgi:putative SOS response-associated peptidase YedK
MVNWGYRPSLAAERGIPIAINARIEKAATLAFFRGLWKSCRSIVPADGWYEWTGEKGHKQPWYLRLKTDKPMFLAAITNYRPDKEPVEGTRYALCRRPTGALAEAACRAAHPIRCAVVGDIAKVVNLPSDSRR